MSQPILISPTASVVPGRVIAVQALDETHTHIHLDGRAEPIVIDAPFAQIHAVLGKDVATLESAAKTLLDAIDAEREPMGDLVTWAYEHGYTYTGKSFFPHVEKLREILEENAISTPLQCESHEEGTQVSS